MFWVLRGKNLESQGNLKRLHCESVSQLHDCRLRVRLLTSRMGVANHERSRTTMTDRTTTLQHVFPMCVIESVDHHSVFAATDAIIPRIILSSSSS